VRKYCEPSYFAICAESYWIPPYRRSADRSLQLALGPAQGGKFILRIEDTDQKRYVPGADKELFDSLHWLGIEWDEGAGAGGDRALVREGGGVEVAGAGGVADRALVDERVGSVHPAD
jgi:glutamyl-tRNA synthetase